MPEGLGMDWIDKIDPLGLSPSTPMRLGLYAHLKLKTFKIRVMEESSQEPMKQGLEAIQGNLQKARQGYLSK